MGGTLSSSVSLPRAVQPRYLSIVSCAPPTLPDARIVVAVGATASVLVACAPVSAEFLEAMQALDAKWGMTAFYEQRQPIVEQYGLN